MTRATSSVRNFHLPLSEELHRELRAESTRTGRPTTALVREAVERWLDAQRRTARHAEIALYAARWGGSEVDLDEALERAGVENLLSAPRKRRRRAK